MTRPPVEDPGFLTSRLFFYLPGHPLKIYSEPNTGEGGLALHSVEGAESPAADGIPDRFLSDEREPDNPHRFTAYAAASCKFVLRKWPSLHVQLYTVDASEWCSGGREANTTTWSIEAEGRAGEPLDDHQISGLFVIAHAWEYRHGRRLVDGVTVRPHHQLASEYGYAPTACESNRYARAREMLAARTKGGAMLTEDQVRLWAQEEAGRVFLPLMEQLLDLKPETFSDDASLAAVRAAVARANAVPPQIVAIGEAVAALADGAVEAAAIFAAMKEATE